MHDEDALSVILQRTRNPRSDFGDCVVEGETAHPYRSTNGEANLGFGDLNVDFPSVVTRLIRRTDNRQVIVQWHLE